MQILIALALAAAAVSSTAPRSEPLLVRAVIDGTTIDVARVGHVRLLGLDAPVASRRGGAASSRLARAARERLAALVLRRWVRLETDEGKSGASGRHVAFVFREDGLFVNLVLLREGLARLGAKRPRSHDDELRRAQAEAQSFRRGIWGAKARYTRSRKSSRPTPSAPRP